MFEPTFVCWKFLFEQTKLKLGVTEQDEGLTPDLTIEDVPLYETIVQGRADY
jgi:hypothetical protein